jgi:FkbM family methyltransferase
MKKHLKRIWKKLMVPILKLYTKNPNLIVSNELQTYDSKTYSQFGQDLFVLEHIFKNKSDGFFVDIGGNHPTHCSNTFLLEQKGWNGIALEPQASLRELWKDVRKTPCLPYAIGPENKIVTFIEGLEEDGLSGLEGHNKVTKSSHTIQVEQITLSELAQRQNITHIDYLSIDVEGYEMEVLKGIDFSKIDITVIGIENDIAFHWIPIIGKKIGAELGSNVLRKYIMSRGYTYIGRMMCDDFFVKNDR